MVKTKIILLLFLFLSSLPLYKCNTKKYNGVSQNLFQTPPNEYLPVVYWFWNGDIKHEKIKWQLEEIKRSGTVSNVCILAWEGLTEEYLSDDWFSKVKYACEIAKELDLGVWLYDEKLWPSGYADGKILKTNPELIAKCLSQSEYKCIGPKKVSIKIATEPIAIITAKVEEKKIKESTLSDLTEKIENNILTWNVPEGEWIVNVYSIENCTFNPTFSCYNYVDLLDEKVARKFIEITHEEYYNRMSEYFGNVIKAIITDEPGSYCNITLGNWEINTGTIPWTSDFLRKFKEIKGYDLKIYLPAIWHDIGLKTAKVRIDYYDVFGDLLQISYFKQLHDWCEDHKTKLNIQPIHEETLKSTVRLQGDYFKALEFAHIIGADDVYSWDKKLITPKIASSAGRISGSRNVYCEVFAAYGWELTMNEMKAVTDCLYSRGINNLMLSAFYFDFDKDWRFEIPPSLFYRTTFWPYLHYYTSYTQRLSYILSDGRNITPIAILYPIKTVQALITPSDEQAVDTIDANFIKLSNALLQHQCDFDYINEDALTNKTKIVVNESKTTLRLSNEESWIDYEVVILPYISVIDKSSLNKINEFLKNGGKAIAYGRLPFLSSDCENLEKDILDIWGISNEAVSSHMNIDKSGGIALYIKDDVDLLIESVKNIVNPDIKLSTNQESVNYIHKVKNNTNIYFISNNSDSSISTTVSFSVKGIPQIWNPENGDISFAKEFKFKENYTILPLRLPPYGSSLILFEQYTENIPHVTATNMKIEDISETKSEIFVKVTSTSKGGNHVSIEYNGKDYAKKMVLEGPQIIKLHKNWKFRPKDMSFDEETREVGTWTKQQIISYPNYYNITKGHPYFSGTGIYSQSFTLEKALLGPQKRILLEFGKEKDIIEVWLNDKKIGTRCWPPFEFDITEFVKEENNLEVQVTNTMANKLEQKPIESGLLQEPILKVYDTFEIHLSK